MKTHSLRNWTAVCVSVLALSIGASALADGSATANEHGKSITGTVRAVDAKEGVLRMNGFFGEKKFNLGDNCIYTMDKGAVGKGDLRPGQKVTINYQSAHGVLVVDHVTIEPMRFEGVVMAIDSENHRLVVRERMLDKTFQIANDCKVVMHNNNSGTLGDIRSGERVTVTFETPDKTATAMQIDHTSATFTGTLTAIDLSERTLKAKTMLGTQRFNVANGCTIAIKGNPTAELRDLKPGDRMTFSYDKVNGINVATRIVEAEEPVLEPVATTARTSR